MQPLSTDQFANLLTRLEPLRALTSELTRTLFSQLGPEVVTRFASVPPPTRDDLDSLLELVRARAQVEDDLDHLPVPNSPTRDLERVWCLIGTWLLETTPDDTAGPHIVRRLRDLALALWGGAWAEHELIRLGGPSLRAVHLRIGLEDGSLTEGEVAAALRALDVRDRADWGTAYETLTKQISLPVDLRRVFDLRNGFFGIRRQIADDRRDAARRLTDSPRWECLLCFSQWQGHGKGRCLRCGATGDDVRRM